MLEEPNFTMGAALDLMWRGYRVARRGWNGRGMWIAIQQPDAGSKMTKPYVYMSTASGDLIPWLASQADLLADDWYSVGRIETPPVPTPVGLTTPVVPLPWPPMRNNTH